LNFIWILAQDTPFCITQYDEAVGEKLREFVKLGHQISGDLDEAVEIVACAFSEMRKFIWDASGQAELTGNGLSEKLSPISQNVEKMGAYASSHRTSKLFNHLSALAGGVPALGWLAVKKTPGPHIKEMRDAALFYINRIYKEYKDGDKTHTEWAKSWVELLSSLEKYVRQVHTTGLVWNSAPPVQSAPPPVPFIPEGVIFFFFYFILVDTGGDRSALFAEINKGSDITKGLKKVTKDMMTHKNPALRGPLEPSKPNIAKKTAPKKDTEPERPPKLVLENGKQWNVVNLVVEITDMKQTVYIYKCEGCLIQINGKVNSVTLDGCKKTSVVFGNLLSQIEVINCQSVQIQSTGTMPTVSIQKTDGCQVYLNKDSLNAEIVASKSSTMNVLVPVKEDGDYQEFPVPEQFKTVFDGSKLVTTVSDIV
uniref:Adenylyl cyclase-associated protein n=1 Tax=Syphacia muris TaxID=451379 RepID=A0A0N5AST7_9BILA